MQRLRLPLVVLAVIAAIAALVLGFQGVRVGAFLSAIATGWLLCASIAAFDTLWGIAATALGGAGVSVYLAHQHLAASAGEPSICAINSTFDCDAVNTSAYSEMFGIPLSLYGLGFYVALAGLAAFRRTSRPGHAGAPHLLRLGGIGAVLYSLFLGWVSHSMGKWCLFCISLYGVNALLLVLSWCAVAKRDALPNAGRWPTLGQVLTLGGGDRSFATAIGVGIATFAVGILVYQGQKNDQADPGTSASGSFDLDELSKAYTQTAGKVELDGSEPIMGDPSAPILIVEYADFACPYCAKASAFMHDIVRADPKVQLRFKNYPISGNCNRFVEGERHATSCPAAISAECAKNQGKYWELSDLLFKNQQYQEAADIDFMAKQIGLDMNAFHACQADPNVLQGVKNDVEAAGRLDISGTPSFFIRGIVGDDFVEVHAKAETIEALIKAAEAGAPLPAPGPHKSEAE